MSNAGYISLDSILADYMNEANKSVNDHFRLWNILFRGMDNLGLDAFYSIKTAKLVINSNLTADLPPDYGGQWIKVGVLNGIGEIIPLYYNDKLTKYADLFSDRLTQTQDNTLISQNFGTGIWFNYWNGYAYTNIYGVSSGSPFVGSFAIDEANGVIVLNEHFQYSYLMIEYLCVPKQGQEYYVPFQFREALIAWLRWRDIISIPVKTHMDNSNVMMRRKEFYNERRNAIAQWKPVRIYDEYQVSQEQTRIAIKD
jgi:hypothetical protein